MGQCQSEIMHIHTSLSTSLQLELTEKMLWFQVESQINFGPPMGHNVSHIYGSVSAGRGKWLLRVIFFQKVEHSCV